MNSLFADFPSQSDLLEWYAKNGTNRVYEVNGHFHTPYSFSAFSDLKQVFMMADKERLSLLGINDFYTTAGYEEFTDLCDTHRKFPLYNIEFMGLLRPEQEKGLRINDPNNPGRIYFCGKALDFPVDQESRAMGIIRDLSVASLVQTREMVEKTSAHLVKTDPKLSLDYGDLLKNLTKGMLRERHIAKAIRIRVFELYKTDNERRKIFSRIFGGKECISDLNKNTAVEEEIRAKVLKAGGPGFVKEDPRAFMDLQDVINTIIEAGGIPTYPCLCDDINDNFTEFEKDPEFLYNQLTSRDIYSIEFIPGRNAFGRLKEYSNFFHDRKFIVTYGTEHNTPEMIPLKADSRGGKPLDDELRAISFEGACVMAAHQYMRAKKLSGYINEKGQPRIREIDQFIELGNAVVEFFLHN
jgi:hypothetical protein